MRIIVLQSGRALSSPNSPSNFSSSLVATNYLPNLPKSFCRSWQTWKRGPLLGLLVFLVPRFRTPFSPLSYPSFCGQPTYVCRFLAVRIPLFVVPADCDSLRLLFHFLFHPTFEH